MFDVFCLYLRYIYGPCMFDVFCLYLREREYNKVQACLGLKTFTPNFRPVGLTDIYIYMVFFWGFFFSTHCAASVFS